MTVSDRDRAYMRKLAAFKTASHAQARSSHLALPLSVRLQRSWQLYRAHNAGRSPARPDDPSPFYERARALGLCDR
jgi:hypothetical protein